MTALGYVMVFECSDGGTGDPANVIWQFFVGKQPVSTKNSSIAETMKLALMTNSLVQVTYDPQGNVISQARIAFEYLCEQKTIQLCIPGQDTRTVCEVRRFDPCDEERVHDKPGKPG